MKKSFLPALLLFATICSAQWTGARMDTLTHNAERDEISRQSFAIDAGNNLHLISVRENGAGWMVLYFNHPVNGSWSVEDTVSIGPSAEPTLAVTGQDGIPYIACTEDSVNEIILYHKTGTSWTREQVTNNLTNDFSPSIALDENGFVHLAWILEDPAGTYKINYANNRNGNWNIQTLVNSQLGPFGSGAAPQIAIQPGGVAHIVYRGGNFGTYRILHAYNDSLGGSNWNFDFPSSPNAEDLSSSMVVTPDSTVHLLVSGNDGFGFPVHAYYMEKISGAISFGNAVDVANGFSAEVGSLFISNNTAACVLNEVSGNFYTGNLIYSDENSGWSAVTLLSTQDIYNGQLIIDQNGNGFAAAYQGNTFQTEEIVVYGPDNTAAITNVTDSQDKVYGFIKGESLYLKSSKSFSGEITLYDIAGKKIQSVTLNIFPGETEKISLSGCSNGVYLLQGISGENNFTLKINYTH